MAELFESDVTKFLRDLFEKNPQLADEQKKARAIWWDQEVDFEAQKSYEESNVPQKAYVYFSLPDAPQTPPKQD